ncbi:4786_t:CDS:2 [Entrophospora sp. SA101]|nr:4786_t:CDS:2 [Entrophospora sp. SA101]
MTSTSQTNISEATVAVVVMGVVTAVEAKDDGDVVGEVVVEVDEKDDGG